MYVFILFFIVRLFVYSFARLFVVLLYSPKDMFETNS